MFANKLELLLALIALVMIVIGGYLFYLYQEGGSAHYHPPVSKTASPKAQLVGHLTTLSQAIEAYHAKNLRYPERLEQLQPEFLDKIPLEPKAGNNFKYESDGLNQYRVGIADPAAFGFRELFIENGKIIQH